MQAAHFNLRIDEVPATCRYFADASSVRCRPGLVYGVKTLWAAAGLVTHRSGIVASRKFSEPGLSESETARTAAAHDPADHVPIRRTAQL